MWAVDSLHEERKGIDREWREYTPTEPELMDRAKEVVESLDEGPGVPRGRVVAVLVDEHEATETQAEDAIEDILKSGLGYEPMEGRLKTI